VNPFILANLQGTDSRLLRVLQDMTDRINVLSRDLESIQSAPSVEGAKKESPIEGLISLPSPSGNGFIRVNQDGVIASYTSPGSMAGVSRSILHAFDNVGNVGTGLQTLRSFPLPINSLRTNGDYFKARFGGVVGSNDDNKRIAFSYDGTALLDTGLVDWDGFGYVLEVTVIRADSTHVNTLTSIILGNVNIDSAGGIASNGAKLEVASSNNLVVANLNSNPTILLLQGESATATNSNVNNNIAIVDITNF
jgi:hypothetical protein